MTVALAVAALRGEKQPAALGGLEAEGKSKGAAAKGSVRETLGEERQAPPKPRGHRSIKVARALRADLEGRSEEPLR